MRRRLRSRDRARIAPGSGPWRRDRSSGGRGIGRADGDEAVDEGVAQSRGESGAQRGGVVAEQFGDRVDDPAQRELAVAGAEHAAQRRVHLDRPSQPGGPAQDDMARVGGPGRARGLLDDVGVERAAGGEERVVVQGAGVEGPPPG